MVPTTNVNMLIVMLVFSLCHKLNLESLTSQLLLSFVSN